MQDEEITRRLQPSLVGHWRSRVIVGSQGEGMQWEGPNPPFKPEPGAAWATDIDEFGNGTVDFADWKLSGKFADEEKRFLFGTWTDSEPQTGKRGEFCLMLVRDPDDAQYMFIGVSKNQTGAWQAWWGKKS